MKMYEKYKKKRKKKGRGGGGGGGGGESCIYTLVGKKYSLVTILVEESGREITALIIHE